MKKIFFRVISTYQVPILYISYYMFHVFKKNNYNEQWVIGVEEIASCIYNLNKTLPSSVSVCLTKNRFYNLKYDYYLNINSKYFLFFINSFYGPYLLGKLAASRNNFWYIWSTGFLVNRYYEFKFLKSRNKKVVCMFVGDDIRSPRLTLEYYKKMNIDGFIEYVGEQDKYYLSENYNNKKKEIARIADKYADFIFNHQTDQLSYLKNTNQHSWPYMYDARKFNKNDLKFNTNNLKVLHAPSNMFVKGTPLVRAAIKKLQTEGYKFDYVELKNVDNTTVIKELKSAHIVLNQFYTFTMGVFAIEAMANHCAVLQSADASIEKGIPAGSEDAWKITQYWEVYDNLKYLLDNPEKIKYYADNGYAFAYENYTYEAAGEYITKVLKENGIIEL
jgi:hypothetical protein